jgi:hypothetical protein
MDRENPGNRARLVLRSHYRLRDKPVRTLEALRIFLRDEATAVFDALRAGREVEVREGHRADVEQLAQAMQAQGFEVQVTPL